LESLHIIQASSNYVNFVLRVDRFHFQKVLLVNFDCLLNFLLVFNTVGKLFVIRSISCQILLLFCFFAELTFLFFFLKSDTIEGTFLMSYPCPETNPAKFLSAFASNVNTTLNLFYWGSALWAFSGIIQDPFIV